MVKVLREGVKKKLDILAAMSAIRGGGLAPLPLRPLAPTPLCHNGHMRKIVSFFSFFMYKNKFFLVDRGDREDTQKNVLFSGRTTKRVGDKPQNKKPLFFIKKY